MKRKKNRQRKGKEARPVKILKGFTGSTVGGAIDLGVNLEKPDLSIMSQIIEIYWPPTADAVKSFKVKYCKQGNDERQDQLKDGKYFSCTCLRCADPTEFGTEMSSLKCPRCYKGLLRPKLWQCSFCQRSYHSSLIKMTLRECRRRIDEIRSPDTDTLEKLLKKLSFTFHPHHYLVLEIEQNLIRLYTQSAPETKNLRRKIEICNKFIDIFRKIEPGISRIVAVGLYELHSAVVSLAERIYKNKEIDKEGFMKMLLLAESTLKSSVKSLLYEPVKSPEGRLAQNALSELKMLRATIGNFQLEEKKVEKKKNKKENKKKK